MTAGTFGGWPDGSPQSSGSPNWQPCLAFLPSAPTRSRRRGVSPSPTPSSPLDESGGSQPSRSGPPRPGESSRSRTPDLTGRRFGRLVVVGRAPRAAAGGAPPWLCLCVCGTEKTVRGDHLRNGGTRSCGCLTREGGTFKGLIDITEQRFGRWTVVGRDRSTARNGLALWHCRCDCGRRGWLPGWR